MRLNSIKLAGFKSFVDPTQLILKGNLTGVVGPNGCGKSNIVDAIYSVLGSGSKNLRAAVIADVIFNGTSTRKPVAQASVELVFDNNDSRIGGEYAQYPEISIRRELTRDGQSNYSINGTRCRRKDITDIFLGTGLGQNSYAIIEQGMISRLIEAKPEELRAHVEEAAGTSKYKERRRETENRIKHTRENLERLNDLREEQTKQLGHLQRQANAAERFKALKQEQRLLRAQLQTILWQQISTQLSVFENQIKEQEVLLESKLAEITDVDKKIECKREARIEQSDQVSELQSKFYSLGSQINQIEQQINHSKERKKQLEADKLQLEQNLGELKQQLFEDQSQIQELESAIVTIEETFNESRILADEYKEKLTQSEMKMYECQEQWDELNRISAQNSKQIEVEKTKIHHLEQKQQSLLQRIGRIRDEESQQNCEQSSKELVILQEHQAEMQQQIEELEDRLASLLDQMTSEKTLNQESQQEVNRITKELRDHQARYASLEALQRIALGKNDHDITAWLQQNSLNEKPRLAEGLEVDPGWETAIETVLATYLDAICIDDFSDITQMLAGVQNADITLFNTKSSNQEYSSSAKLVPLQTKLRSQWTMQPVLASIYGAENVAEALAQVHLLGPHESIVTKDGIWLGSSWAKICRHVTQKTGILQREHEIKEIQQDISVIQTRLAQQERISQESQDRLTIFTDKREQLQQQLHTLRAKNSDYLAQIKAKDNFIQELQRKQMALQEEMRENDQSLAEVEMALEEAKTQLVAIQKLLNDDQEIKSQHVALKDALRNELDEVRLQAATQKQKADESKVRLESTRSQIHLIAQNIARLEKQVASGCEREQLISQSLTEINDPLPELSIELQQALERRSAIEENLLYSRQTLENFEQEMTSLDKERHQHEKSLMDLRNLLEEKRLSCQSLLVKQTHCLEQIQELNFILEEIIKELPQENSVDMWEQQLIKIDNRIQRLGPINLAAIEEYAQLSERKEYLDKQYNDLIEALDTLENAIRKIDRETRARFKETYTKLNESFKVYFNQIFGGGEAYLELTSDDLLETGVMVRAQPPGKKNSTIHLLSGGEKALTAIALVFAIFNLNPAPFCVLDEVDAPLDDANVGRFCNLVRKMSEKIQFIFISHNKIAIEMAQQLAGVTMHEPGVSRLVSVDIEQAIDMATA